MRANKGLTPNVLSIAPWTIDSKIAPAVAFAAEHIEQQLRVSCNDHQCDLLVYREVEEAKNEVSNYLNEQRSSLVEQFKTEEERKRFITGTIELERLFRNLGNTNDPKLWDNIRQPAIHCGEHTFGNVFELDRSAIDERGDIKPENWRSMANSHMDLIAFRIPTKEGEHPRVFIAVHAKGKLRGISKSTYGTLDTRAGTRVQVIEVLDQNNSFGEGFVSFWDDLRSVFFKSDLKQQVSQLNEQAKLAKDLIKAEGGAGKIPQNLLAIGLAFLTSAGVAIEPSMIGYAAGALTGMAGINGLNGSVRFKRRDARPVLNQCGIQFHPEAGDIKIARGRRPFLRNLMISLIP